MQAWMLHSPGPAQNFVLQEVEIPHPRPGWSLIRVRAFGLNRSEWFTRNGDSPSVKLPRVLGIECVGELVDGGGLALPIGSRVAAMMGGMGREFDGSYGEYTLVPNHCVFPLQSRLEWAQLGALPEMLQTTHGSLYKGLEIDRASSLLIRGGTSSIGLAALSLAKSLGLMVATTSRNPAQLERLYQAGADQVWLDDGALSEQLASHPNSFYDRVLELVGTRTLADSLRCVHPGGIVCMTGILGGQWLWRDFQPMVDIPSGVKLSAYSGDAGDISAAQLQQYVTQVEQGRLSIPTGAVFNFEQLIEAHELMDANTAAGKIVVLGKI